MYPQAYRRGGRGNRGKRSLGVVSEKISLNQILAFNSWASLSKLLYPSGPQFAKFIKSTPQGKDQMR